ncbi:hypothetical protein [Sorangium sp. So ce131]|uniref:hypothetical protein n=1 Tax=Sorangium sp. So ce131 TaxID=3133282 RepID=UPI003F615FB3
MRNLAKVLVTTGSAATLGLVSFRAHAQAADVEPPLPNVLLLVDTSGSMERTVAGGEPDCTPLTPPANESLKSRWAKLVESLTGPIPNFSCYAQPRTSAAFVQEFSLGTVEPYDKNYYIPFHRLLSAGCTPGPGATENSIGYHHYNDASQSCPAWTQPPTGLLDVYRDRIRFGLMTFDTLPDASTGLLGGTPDHAGGMEGMWSYFPEFQTGGFPARGNPPDCAVEDVEVGARNPAAPLWEGPLVPFPDFTAPITDVHTTNTRIQDALIATRPYGATPIAGMLSDARHYILGDGTTWQGRPLGPRDDPYIAGGCRKTSIVLISDGEPNLDVRPSCAQAPGPGPEGTGCPYEEPHVIAHSLNSNINPNRRVRTYTVGFGLSTEAGTDCATISESDFQSGGRCDGATGALKACCTLSRIAIEGGTDHGYFPDDANELSAVMSQIFAHIAANSTSRTLPVFATAAATGNTGSTAEGVAYQFSSSFSPPPDGSLWTGNLERKRFVCEAVNGVLTTQLEDIDPGKGDDFAANMNSNDLANPRRFFSVIGTPDAGAIWSTRTIRPAAAADDDLSDYTGTVTGNGDPVPAAAFADELGSAPRALELDPSSPLPSQCSGGLQTTTAQGCAERIIEWETGEPMPSNIASRDGNELGSIYHATPVVMGPPRDLIPDESYQLFAEAQANRPLVLYTATTDGQLHAFQVAPSTAADPLKVDRLQNNELWSFLPPYVLPRLLPTFNQQSLLLDGAPVVKNVVFERTAAQAAAAGTAAGATWRTVLVASGGAGGSFYYALDVTDPRDPQFLWQLSTDRSGNPLFGETTPTPTIAMVEVEQNGEIREVSVAILAGGTAPIDTSASSCPRQNTTTPVFFPTGSLSVRGSVRCWGTAGTNGVVGPARSLTIVRLDTGEVLRTFRGHSSEAPASIASTLTTVVDFDSPISGVPVAYPSQVGQVADRIYVGDADGTLWRVNLSRPNPADWTVDLAWDAYSLPGDTAASSQPIQTTPIVSLDPLGNKVILFSTGDQEAFTAGGAIETRAWSVTEKPHSGSFRVSENWVIPFTGGKRVTGPISLFNGCAYFSTFTPAAPGTYACADGLGSIWGVDYLYGQSGTPAAYPNACLRVDPLAPAQHFEDQAPGTIVFGVAVTQKPTCVDVETVSDPYFGAQTVIRQASAPEYQLVFHTGAAGSEDVQGAEARTSVRTLPPPNTVVRVDSWASIIE